MIRINSEVLNYFDTLYQLNKDDISIKNFDPGQEVIGQNKRYFSLFIIRQGITKCF